MRLSRLAFEVVLGALRVRLGGQRSRCHVYRGMIYMKDATGSRGPEPTEGRVLELAANLAEPKATLEVLRRPGTYERLEGLGERLETGLARMAADAGVPFTSNRVGSMLTGFFCEERVMDYVSAKRADTKRYARFFHAMLDWGMYFAPSQFEAAFVSVAHTEEEIDRTLEAAERALAV